MINQQRRIVNDMFRAVMGVCCAIQLTVATAYGGWLQTAVGTYDYLEATNWTDNVIDNTFPATLTLAGAQTATFGADHTAASGLVFGYGGNFALTLRAAGGDRSLKLQGDVLVDTTGGTTANVTLGSANSNEKLNIDLDGATRAFEVSASRSLTLRNVVSNGGLVKTGAGTLSLAGANTFEGGVSCNGGIVSAAANSNLGPATGAISFDGGALRLGAQDANTGFSLADRPVTVNIGGGKLYSYKNSGSYTFGQTIAGAGELKTSGGEGWGSPTFVFTASNDVASVRMQNGTHNIDLRHPHAAGVGVLALDSGYAGRAIRLKNDDSVTYAMAGITAPCNFTIDVKQTTAAGVDQTLAIPAFTMTPQDQKDQLTVTGANGYRLQINSVTLVSGWTDKQLTLNPTTAPLTVGNMNIQKGQIFLNGTHAENRVTGVISGDNGGGNVLGNIIKESTSTWTLEGANTYYGRTTVNAGALVVNGGIPSANGAIVNVGGTLGGTGTVAIATVKAGGAIAPGPGAGVGTMKFGALTLEEGAALNLGLGVPAASDKVAVNGSLVLDGVVNVAAAEGFGVGYYPIATYTGSLADNGLEVGTTPDPGLVYSVRAGGGLVTLRVNAPGTAIVVR